MRRATILAAAGLLPLLLAACAAPRAEAPAAGPWRAVLDSSGGDLPFRVETERSPRGPRAWVVNGEERIPFSSVELNAETEEWFFRMTHYDSVIRAFLAPDGRAMDGVWEKTTTGGEITRMPFEAVAGEAPRFVLLGASDREPAGSVDGRWEVRFESEETPAVGLFETRPDGTLAGTFLTATGDYRYLAGSLEGRRLRLSTFDGAHAFLFHATLKEDGSLAGDFWSGDTWHETWTARRSDDASLPDAFAMSAWNKDFPLEELAYPDLDGEVRSLADPAFAGKARIIEVFGSWCPNCGDAARLLAELHRRYRERGLSVVGLAFELTGDLERDTEQVRRYAERHGVEFPLLVAGLKDRGNVAAGEALPALDRIRAYPTIIFLHADGRVRAVYTGFSGPATGEAHRRLRAEFEALIEELLAE